MKIPVIVYIVVGLLYARNIHSRSPSHQPILARSSPGKFFLITLIAWPALMLFYTVVDRKIRERDPIRLRKVTFRTVAQFLAQNPPSSLSDDELDAADRLAHKLLSRNHMNQQMMMDAALKGRHKAIRARSRVALELIRNIDAEREKRNT